MDRVQRAGGYSKRDLLKLMAHAFEASFLPRADKDAYIESLEIFATAQGIAISPEDQGT